MTNNWSLVRYRMLYDFFQTMQMVVCYQDLILLFLTEKSYQWKNKTVLNLVRYSIVVTDLKNWDIPVHSSIFNENYWLWNKMRRSENKWQPWPVWSWCREWRQLLTQISSSINLCKTVPNLQSKMPPKN